MLNCANTIGGVELSDRLYYEESQKIWQSKAKEQEREIIDKRFSELWERMRDTEQLLQAAFRHIEELKKCQQK